MRCRHTTLWKPVSYIEAAALRDGGKVPLFRSAAGRIGALTKRPMNRVDAWRMIQRGGALACGAWHWVDNALTVEIMP